VQSVESQFADYASHHQTRGNKLCHHIGIPLIMLSLLGMLARIEVGPIDAAIALIAAVELYYLILDWRLALLMLVLTAAIYLAGTALPMWLLIALFVLGWVSQFVGHSAYEKNQPAFFRNLVHLLIGPLWIVNDLVPVVSPET
jgi:uncharacterized membrane protein YGL010W